MQSRIKRAKLSKVMGREPHVNWLVLARCGAGLATIALVAFAGLRAPINAAALESRFAPAAAAGTQDHQRPPSQHRKQVFDERRARFGGDTGRQGIAREAKIPANELPLALRFFVKHGISFWHNSATLWTAGPCRLSPAQRCGYVNSNCFGRYGMHCRARF